MRRILIIIFLFACVLAGHYFLYTIPIEYSERRTLVMSIATTMAFIYLFGGLSLALQAKGRRLLKIGAFQIFLFALPCIGTIIVRVFLPAETLTKDIASPLVMMYGNVYAFISVLYPLELMRPGWLNFRRGALLFLPVIIIGLIYFVLSLIQRPDVYNVYYWDGVLSNLRVGDIWLRIVIFIYPVWLYIKIFRYILAYEKWCEYNSSSKENKSLDLLKDYSNWFFLILSSYIILSLFDNIQGRMLHSLLFFGFTCYILYHNFFNIDSLINSPFNVKSDDADFAGDENVELEPRCFAEKIPQYKYMLEKWMQEEKPYKNPGFKLLDCMSVLPLNRSYLSRLFNDGYNETFFAFVMRYRLDESIRLLNTHPTLTVASISEKCGFSSPSVFGRAFLKHHGITPLQYRNRCSRENSVN